MKNSLKLAVSVAALLGASASTYGAATNLGELIKNNGSITVGDKIFADFSFRSAKLNASDATVDVTADSHGTYYLTIQGPFVSIGGNDPRDINFNYTVATTSGAALISAIDQSFVLSAGGTGGFILIGETVRSGSFGGPVVAQSSVGHASGSATTPAISDLEDPAAEPLTGDQLVINPTLNKVYVTKDIFFAAFAGGIAGPTTIVQSIHQTTQAPEGGATVAFLGLALAGLGLVRRRFNA